MLYRVVYSERVRQATRELVIRAEMMSRGAETVEAVKRIDYLLALYPQFGQPLHDLLLEPAQMCIGVVPPLVVHYVLDENAKHVYVVRPFRPFRSSGLQP